MTVFRGCSTLVFSALLAIFVGCGDSDSASTASNTSATSSDAPRIAIVMKSLANEFFATMAAGAEEHQKQNSDKYGLIVNGIKDETDLSGQVSLVEQMIAQQVDAIVIAPADSKALVPVLMRAQEAGIVVVNIDNKLDEEVLKSSDATIPFVGPDNKAGAKKVGEHLAAAMQEGDKVAILEGIQTSFNGQQRKLGFEEALTAAKLEVVASQSARWEMSIANQTAAGMLTAHPDLKAILACNDNMALGALAAVKEADRLAGVKIVGFDNISAVRQAIELGEILATADQHGDQLAVFGIEYALEAIETGKAPGDKETPVDLITADSI
ncbi:sugar ABC transporter substrate-binding protein [Fuerstiella marisgermanici]|uniref:D-allose-binding periplasmic protein n=1 Tax=Fuerstiella marisgermanici TaxID=1891926 RepID=A0A1P8WK33_9PLAN|nr:sugar ABC transporter substrate-binding protein [Fuerstiella marisgermanici]APZ94425.1 D-allose-binding periplasmic protein precursor [Fuerstiella marisgermanici]